MEIVTEKNIKKIDSDDSIFSLYSIENLSRSCDSLLESNINRNYNEFMENKIKTDKYFNFYMKNYRCSKSCNNLIYEEEENKKKFCEKENNLSKSYDDVFFLQDNINFLNKNNYFFKYNEVRRRRNRDYRIEEYKRDTPTMEDAINIIKRNLSSPTLNIIINSTKK